MRCRAYLIHLPCGVLYRFSESGIYSEIIYLNYTRWD